MRQSAVLSVLLFCSLLSAVAHSAEEEWTYIGREQHINGFHLNQKGKLHYNGNQLKNFDLEKTADKIAISPLSPGGKYAVAFSFGDQESQCALLQLKEGSSASIRMDAPPMIWSNWSPEGSYLLLASINGEQVALHSITVEPVQTRIVPVQLVNAEEILEFDTGSVQWTDPTIFEIEVEVHCSSQAPDCISERREQILRSYKLKVNANTLKVQSEEMPLQGE